MTDDEIRALAEGARLSGYLAEGECLALADEALARGAEISRLKTRRFPVLSESRNRGYREIPWSVAEEAYVRYSAEQGCSQSLERLAERGGFGESELDAYVPNWRARVDEITQLRERVAQLQTDLANARVRCEHLGTLVDHTARAIKIAVDHAEPASALLSLWMMLRDRI